MLDVTGKCQTNACKYFVNVKVCTHAKHTYYLCRARWSFLDQIASTHTATMYTSIHQGIFWRIASMEPYGGIIMFNLTIIIFLGSGHPQMPITVSLINCVQGSHKILMKNKKLVPYM